MVDKYKYGYGVYIFHTYVAMYTLQGLNLSHICSPFFRFGRGIFPSNPLHAGQRFNAKELFNNTLKTDWLIAL